MVVEKVIAPTELPSEYASFSRSRTDLPMIVDGSVSGPGPVSSSNSPDEQRKRRSPDGLEILTLPRFAMRVIVDRASRKVLRASPHSVHSTVLVVEAPTGMVTE